MVLDSFAPLILVAEDGAGKIDAVVRLTQFEEWFCSWNVRLDGFPHRLKVYRKVIMDENISQIPKQIPLEATSVTESIVTGHWSLAKHKFKATPVTQPS